MLAIIPIAGKSSRFKAAGYSAPKWTLPLKDERSMLRTAMDGYEAAMTILVAEAENKDFIPGAVGIDKTNWFTHEIHTSTSGPMETVLRAKSFLKTNDELLINFSDCFSANGLSDFLETLRTSNCDAGVFCFRSDDMRFQRDPTGDYALGGIYWFRHANDFLKRAREFQPHPNLSPARVAFTYRWGQLARWNLYVDTKNYVDLGTPEDYETYIGKRTIAKGDSITLPRFDTFEAFMADTELGNWRKDRIGWLLYRSVTKQTLTEAENRELAADMQNQAGETNG